MFSSFLFDMASREVNSSLDQGIRHHLGVDVCLVKRSSYFVTSYILKPFDNIIFDPKMIPSILVIIFSYQGTTDIPILLGHFLNI